MSDQTVHHLKQAEAPSKEALMALVDELRSGVEDGTILALVAIKVHPNREWTNRSAGDLRMLEFAGLLGRCWLDANAMLAE